MMKRFLLFLLLGICIYNTAKSASIIISIKTCNPTASSPSGWVWYTVKIAPKKGKSITYISTTDTKDSTITVDTGYSTITLSVGAEIYTKDSFYLTDEKPHRISFCVDKLKPNYDFTTRIFENLKNGDSATLNLSSSGCFHHYNCFVTVFNKNEEYLIKVNPIDENTGETKPYQYYKPNQEQLSLLIAFEKELEIIAKELLEKKNFHCTTQTNYSIVYNGKIIKFLNDNACHWDDEKYWRLFTTTK